MESPLVSVCIPAYNNADTILETIQSVLTQTYQNLELIVVDDRSTDDTYQVVKTFAKQAGDDRLHLYQNEKNLGMAGNWNHCMELCKGDFIKLLCADEKWRSWRGIRGQIWCRRIRALWTCMARPPAIISAITQVVLWRAGKPVASPLLPEIILGHRLPI